MYDIFLSYSSKDLERVRPLFDALTAQGWVVFWDHLSIRTGSNWRAKIDKSINASRCVIVIWSKNSIHSEYVIEEAEIAIRRKILVPIALDNISPPFGFSQRQTLSVKSLSFKANDPAREKLLESVRHLVDQSIPVSSKLNKQAHPFKKCHLLVVFLVLLLGLLVYKGISIISSKENSLDNIKRSGELLIATRDNLPPMGFRQDGKLVGIDIELASSLASSLGVKPKWVFFEDINQREDLLLKGKVDLVISSYSITAEREKQIGFSVPYFDSASVIMIRKDDLNTIKSYKDLADKKVAVLRESLNADTIRALAPTAEQIEIDGSMLQGYRKLEKKEVDAVVYDKPMIEYFIANNPSKGFLKINAPPLDPNNYAIGVDLSKRELLEYINNFLEQAKINKLLEQLAAKYATSSIVIQVNQQVDSFTEYTIQQGDTLSKIAFNAYGDPSLWEGIYAYNHQLGLIKFAGLIRAGQKIKIPLKSNLP